MVYPMQVCIYRRHMRSLWQSRSAACAACQRTLGNSALDQSRSALQPLVKSRTIEMVQYDKLPAGQVGLGLRQSCARNAASWLKPSPRAEKRSALSHRSARLAAVTSALDETTVKAKVGRGAALGRPRAVYVRRCGAVRMEWSECSGGNRPTCSGWSCTQLYARVHVCVHCGASGFGHIGTRDRCRMLSWP